MKRKLLLCLFLLSFSGIKLKAQIVNAGFEAWETDTTYFNGFLSLLPKDTIIYDDPVGWTSSNVISKMKKAGGFTFVEQSSSSFAGQSAIRIKTDTTIPINVGIATKSFTLPGFVLNGDFPIDLVKLFSNGSNITPTSVPGAGQPFTKRLAKVTGQYNYEPVFNPNTNHNDTCLVWAVLRKGALPVASAVFKSTRATDGYEPFDAEFTYLSCETPDTLVILIGSSIPNVPGLFGAQSNLVRGSILYVDSLGYDTLAADYNFTPIARFDTASTNKNVAKNVNIKLNDDDCNNGTGDLILNIESQPLHGTLNTPVNNAFITYTPNTDYVGLDTFSYSLNDGTNTSPPAKVAMSVNDKVGIEEVVLTPLFLYPNPTKDELQLQFETNEVCTAIITDGVGKRLNSVALTGNHTSINVAQLASGIYSLQIVNKLNQLIGRGKFAVTK